MVQLEAIILKWTGTESIVANSLGSYVDARKLAAMEKLLGRNFGTFSWGSVLGPNQCVAIMNGFSGLVNHLMI